MATKESDDLFAVAQLENAWRSFRRKHYASTWKQLEHVLRPRSREITVVVLIVAFFALPYLLVGINRRSNRGGSLLSDRQQRNFFRLHNQTHLLKSYNRRHHNESLEEILEAAALPDKTVVVASLNAAWAENNTMIDTFLESFRVGIGTQHLLDHLVIVAFDQKAFNRCIVIHEYCLRIETPGVDFSQEKLLMSTDFLKMMWRRIQFLGTVLEKGYNFIFTDADILWLRDPFQHFKETGVDLELVDMAVASDRYSGNPSDVFNNWANTGFIYARATNQTRSAYSYWYQAREQHPDKKEQDVFDTIKVEGSFQAIGLRLRFLDFQYFAGFCTISRSNFAKVVTMHATCCTGLHAKLIDLRAVLHFWALYLAELPSNSSTPSPRFKRPSACAQTWKWPTEPWPTDP